MQSTRIFGKVVEVGCEIPDEDETPTPIQVYVLQRNFQALNILHTSVSLEEFDKIEDAPTAKDAWDTLLVNHQGSRKVRESRTRKSLKEDSPPIRKLREVLDLKFPRSQRSQRYF